MLTQDHAKVVLRALCRRYIDIIRPSFLRGPRRSLRETLSALPGISEESKSVVVGKHWDGVVFAGWWFQHTAPSSPKAIVAAEVRNIALTFAGLVPGAIQGNELKINRNPNGMPKAKRGGMTNAVYDKLNAAYLAGLYSVVKNTENEYGTLLRTEECGGFSVMTANSSGSHIRGKTYMYRPELLINRDNPRQMRESGEKSRDPIEYRCMKLIEQRSHKENGVGAVTYFDYDVDDGEIEISVADGFRGARKGMIKQKLIDAIDLRFKLKELQEKLMREKALGRKRGKKAADDESDTATTATTSGAGSSASSSASSSSSSSGSDSGGGYSYSG